MVGRREEAAALGAQVRCVSRTCDIRVSCPPPCSARRVPAPQLHKSGQVHMGALVERRSDGAEEREATQVDMQKVFRAEAEVAPSALDPPRAVRTACTVASHVSVTLALEPRVAMQVNLDAAGGRVESASSQTAPPGWIWDEASGGCTRAPALGEAPRGILPQRSAALGAMHTACAV